MEATVKLRLRGIVKFTYSRVIEGNLNQKFK